MNKQSYYLFFFTLLLVNNLYSLDLTVKDKNIQFHGVLSQGYLKTTHNNMLAQTEEGTFQFNEFGINFYTDLTQKLSFAGQLMSLDMGPYGNNDLELDYCYFNYYFSNWFNISLGQTKLPYGIHNETRDIDILRTNILLPQGVYNETWRETFRSITGLIIKGGYYLEDKGNFNYNLYAGDCSHITSESGMTKMLEGLMQVNTTDIEINDTYGCTLSWSSPSDAVLLKYSYINTKITNYAQTMSSPMWMMMSLMFSGQIGFPVTITDLREEIKVTPIVYSLQYNVEKFTFTFEYNMINMQENKFYVQNISDSDILLMNQTMDMMGFYVSFNYRFTDNFTAEITYSEFYPDKTDKKGKELARATHMPESGAWYKDLTISTKYNFNDNWMIKLEAHMIDGTANLYIEDNLNDTGFYDVEENYFLFASKITYNF